MSFVDFLLYCAIGALVIGMGWCAGKAMEDTMRMFDD